MPVYSPSPNSVVSVIFMVGILNQDEEKSEDVFKGGCTLQHPLNHKSRADTQLPSHAHTYTQCLCQIVFSKSTLG